jgi:hypothetical protein
MASRRRLQGASSNRRPSERGRLPLRFSTYKAPASRVASRIQKREPRRPLRRSPRLNRLPLLNEATSREAEQSPAAAGERRSLRLKLQPPTGGAVKQSEPRQSFIQVPQPRGQKRGREGHVSGNRKRRRKSDTPLVPEDQPQNTRDIDPIDHWRRSGHFWPQDWSKKPNPTVRHLLARKKSTSSLRRKRSDSELATEASNTPSDQKSREAKSAPYRDVRYSVVLATKAASWTRMTGVSTGTTSYLFTNFCTLSSWFR